MRRIQLRNGQELAQDHIGDGLMKWDPTLDPTLAHLLILSGSVSNHSSQYCINYLRKTQFQWHSGLLNKHKWITACRGKLQLLYQVYKALWYFPTHLTAPTPTLPLYPGFPFSSSTDVSQSNNNPHSCGFYMFVCFSIICFFKFHFVKLYPFLNVEFRVYLFYLPLLIAEYLSSPNSLSKNLSVFS